MPSVTKLSLRNSFCAIQEEPARRMLGLNACNVYNLDVEKLADVARRIGALTPAELSTPIDAIPENAGSLASAASVLGADQPISIGRKSNTTSSSPAAAPRAQPASHGPRTCSPSSS